MAFGNAISFCRSPEDDTSSTCSRHDCPYTKFHRSCLSLGGTCLPPKTWYCPHCSRLPECRRKRGPKAVANNDILQAALLCDTICICSSTLSPSDRLLNCNNVSFQYGKCFHLDCLGYKRLPTTSKTTWKCHNCKFLPHSAARSSSLHNSESCSLIGDGDVNSDSNDEIEITKVNIGQTDKTPSLASLTESDYKIILDKDGWLNCDIIQKTHVYLQEVNPHIEGFQRPTLGIVRNFDIVSGEFIQILNTGNDHWVYISSIGCDAGVVNLYDSLFNDIVSQEVEDQTKDLLADTYVGLNYVPVQQQCNGSDCGVFSIAFATCLVYGSDPKHVTFYVPKMRPHLAHCLTSQTITTFPLL